MPKHIKIVASCIIALSLNMAYAAPGDIIDATRSTGAQYNGIVALALAESGSAGTACHKALTNLPVLPEPTLVAVDGKLEHGLGASTINKQARHVLICSASLAALSSQLANATQGSLSKVDAVHAIKAVLGNRLADENRRQANALRLPQEIHYIVEQPASVRQPTLIMSADTRHMKRRADTSNMEVSGLKNNASVSPDMRADWELDAGAGQGPRALSSDFGNPYAYKTVGRIYTLRGNVGDMVVTHENGVWKVLRNSIVLADLSADMVGGVRISFEGRGQTNIKGRQ